MPEIQITGKKERSPMAKRARKEFPIPKNCCPDKRRIIMRMRENWIRMMLKKYDEDRY